MSSRERFFFFSFLLLCFILLTDFRLPASEQPKAAAERGPGESGERVSRFGQYDGYSKDVYDSAVRVSRYISMRDGVKIAIDILRPANHGKVTEEPLPVIWTHNRYRRAFVVNGRLRFIGDSPDIRMLVKKGYVAASADVRGSGASFGNALGIFWKEETQDAYEITEWLARQPWSNGKIGMFGGSYLGVTQLMAASTKPPHLKALFPVVALFDLYAFGGQGGIFKSDFIKTWSDLTTMLDTVQVAAPVDEDRDGILLKKAIAEHKGNRPLIDIVGKLEFRNSRDEVTGAIPNMEWQPAAYIREINDSGIPMYLWSGWFDSFTRDSFLMFRNFTSPKKLVVGAWSHSPKDPDILKEDYSLLAVEELRWFDYWLKGIDNGIMAEAPITYQVMFEPKKSIWKTAQQWPLAEARETRYYFGQGPSNSVKSINDGILGQNVSDRTGAKDEYRINYATTSGIATRWDNAVGGDFSYPDMTCNDAKGLTYSTPTLKSDLEVTGHPVVHLWLSSAAADGDVFAYLEEIDSQGISHYVTEGELRASHRALHDAPYDNFGLPYHRSFDSDIAALKPGEPAELVFDLEPTSNVFNKGNRLRLTITGADKDNAQTPVLEPAPIVTVYRDAAHASYIALPVVAGVPEKPVSPLFLFYFIIFAVIVLAFAFALYVRARLSIK
jgi:putative CocE/NonD family hydrolase